MQTIKFQAMGSQILIALDSDDLQCLEISREARNWFEHWEQIFSRFRISSELSRLNQNPGIPVRTSDSMMEVLKLSVEIQNMTGGIVNPLILNSLEYSGYSVTFEDLAQNPDFLLAQKGPPLAIQDARIKIIDEYNSVVIPLGYKIDLGGVVKGWAANLAMSRLRSLAPVLVDAGGDIAISGPLRDGASWTIGVANPFSPEENIDIVLSAGGGIATSGRDFRRWKMNDQWQHHLIDPYTSAPAVTDVISATVFNRDAIHAEALAKTAVILGSQKATEWLSHHQDIEYLLILDNREKINSSGYQYLQWEKNVNKP